MKKYKLIKEYPGSSKLGTIVEEDDDGAYYIPDDDSELSFTELDHYPYDYPEFWELVIEKDYEILLLKAVDNHINCPGEIKQIWRSDYNTDCWNIYSIKRLSDGQIFTIGDKVIGYNNSIAKIKTIDLVGEVSLKIGTDKHERFSLKNLKKAKQPLFTTEDGVDIFEGDLVVCFDKDSFCIRNKTYLFKEYDKNDKTYLFFSTKEKAEEYILMNKPCLSINDLIKINDSKGGTKGLPNCCQLILKTDLKKLVKSKL